MARQLRIQFPGALYHITACGNNKQKISLREVGAEIPKKQLYSSRPTLVEIFASNQVRDKKIYQANQKYGYTLKEIASHLHLHYTTISKIISKM